jgi:hypothetical protein
MRTEKARVVVMPAKMASGRVTTQRKGTMSPYTGFGIGMVQSLRQELRSGWTKAPVETPQKL